MSVRAYKIEKTSHNPSFNLWHDEKFVQYLDDVGVYPLLDDGAGYVSITIENIEKITELAKKAGDFDDISDILETLREDMGGDGYADFVCF